MIAYEKRIEQLNKKIERLKQSAEDIELLYGNNYKYQKKQMEIEELCHLIDWYNEKISEDKQRELYRFCRINQCKYFMREKCFLLKIPTNNNCKFCEKQEG